MVGASLHPRLLATGEGMGEGMPVGYALEANRSQNDHSNWNVRGEEDAG